MFFKRKGYLWNIKNTSDDLVEPYIFSTVLIYMRPLVYLVNIGKAWNFVCTHTYFAVKKSWKREVTVTPIIPRFIENNNVSTKFNQMSKIYILVS